MKRRDYLRTVSSTALLPVIATETSEAATTPEIDIQWATSVADSSQILEIETSEEVDRVSLDRYEFGSWSTMPWYNKIDDKKYEFAFDDPTTVVGLHGITLYRNDQQVGDQLLDLEADLLARHIQVSEPNTGRVVVRQLGSAPVSVFNGAIVTAKGNQPDSVAGWQNQRYISLLPQTTSYVQARVTDDAVQAMRGNQAVWVWLRSETGAWYPATVDFSDNGYDPVEVYDIHGVTRH